MKRIRQTIEVSEPLWRALELMSRDMGVDRDALVAQALFQLARQNGYVAPTAIPLSGEPQVAGGAVTAAPGAEPVAQVTGAVPAAPAIAILAAPGAESVVEAAGAMTVAPGALPVAETAAPAAAHPSVAATGVVAPPVVGAVKTDVSPAEPGAGAQKTVPASVDGLGAAVAASAVDTFSADDPAEEPATEPPGVTPVPLAVAQVSSTELVHARMQEILAEVEAFVQPSEGLAAETDDSDDEDSDDASDEDLEDGVFADDASAAEDDVADDGASDAGVEDGASAEDASDGDVSHAGSDEEPSGDSDESEPGVAADDSADDAEASAGNGVKGELSTDDIAAELAALGIVEDSTEAAQAEAPVSTPIAARPLVARPVPKVRPADEAATILEDSSAETTNIVSAPAPLEVFVRWAQGTPVPVSTERFTIGRGPRCNLVVKSERVSREHAVVTRVGDEVFIEDLNSSNGTWFNNERITRHQVSDGDEYMLGTESVSFTMRSPGA
ncbi:FHA domain-containing protein [Myxococcus sp. Y35]|uniref:FHA domain-containing protein n=1 Tax=Pseudomyxococcus flavus TaxID=3115648 RepID=UPI003CFADC4D